MEYAVAHDVEGGIGGGSGGSRPRSESVVGRLRSASDLEVRGLIDPTQKSELQALILSGDERLQTALDKFEVPRQHILPSLTVWSPDKDGRDTPFYTFDSMLVFTCGGALL